MTTLDRSRRPAPGPMRDFDFPDTERFTLGNGLDVRVARVARLPLVSVDLFMRGGEQDIPEERAGLAVLAADALDGGTRRRGGGDLAEALERLGVRVSAFAGWEGTTVSLTCLADRLEEAFPLLAEIVLEPDFPASEVERVRNQRLATIRQRAMDPGSLASDRALRRYFQEATPYARPVHGTEASVSSLSRASLLGYAEAAYRPGRHGGLVVAGDVDPSEVTALAERHLGSWSGVPGEGTPFEAVPATRERKIWLVDRPGSVQSEVRVGHVGTARDTEDYFPLFVGNMLLGGTFTSRLNLNLRERNGFTYGVRSRYSFRSRPGPFEVSTAVSNEVTAPAVREILREMEALVEEGPTSEEVASTRDFAAGIFGLQIETVDQIAARLAHIVVFGLDERYFHDYRDNVRAVTVERTAAALARHLRPREAQVVVVGDAAEVQGPLEALDVGPVEVVRPELGRAAAD
ncbi:MAG: pitrilysin family protein [Gemmatimonadota bacterium]|nr:pitrilysin family protein [Gemmatimonadota bacterium]